MARGSGGSLWVIGGREIVRDISKLQECGAHFRYREGGSKATKGKNAS